jgi:nicotinate-nucleotide adenylyltransferase
MEAKSQRIGFFGGTFNPVHNGHISIANAFLESGFIEALWIFLNPAPPHKNNEPFAPYNLRFQMLQAAFDPMDHSIISDLETELPAPSYTIQTLSFLKDSYPETSFYLCMGKDSYLSFKSWYRWRNILKHCRLLVADRPTEEDETIDPELLAYTHFVEHQPVDISSTQVRDRVAGNKSICDLVPAPVAKIIYEEHLYAESDA